MEQSWAVKYRPRTFEDLRGQPEKAHLRMVLRQGGEFPPLLIFQGPSGTGKTTAARILAAALNCGELTPKGDPCTTCESCLSVQEGTHSGVVEHNSALRNGAEDMRNLQERSYLDHGGTVSVFILDEAQTLSAQAWKVLLKLFEEPPPRCLFILVSSEPTKIPRAIQTRAISYHFGKVVAKEVRATLEDVLSREGAALEGLDFIVDKANGSVREALMLAEQCVRTGTTPQEAFSGRDMGLVFLEALLHDNSKAALACIEVMWRASGSADYVLDRIGESAQNLTHRFYRLPLMVSDPTSAKYDALVKKMTEQSLYGLLATLSEWSLKAKTRPQLVFMWQALRAAVHGKAAPKSKTRSPEAVKNKAVQQPRSVPTAEAISSISI